MANSSVKGSKIGSIRQSLLFARPHTATIARAWILNHVPTGSSVLVESNDPWLPPTFHLYVVNKEGMIEEARSEGENLIPTGAIGYLKNDIQLPDYVVLSGNYYRYANERAKYPEIVSKYEEIIRNRELIYQIGPQANRGRQISIYRASTTSWKL